MTDDTYSGFSFSGNYLSQPSAMLDDVIENEKQSGKVYLYFKDISD